MDINYVIACWSGMRRVNPEAYVKDRPVFIRKHLESLGTLKHSLAQITLVVNKDPNEPPEYREFLNKLPKKIGNAGVELLERPNEGFSWGGYSHVLDVYGDRHSYMLLMEDDYIFTEDNFDRTLMGGILEGKKMGWLSFVIEHGTKDWIMRRASSEAPGGRSVAGRVGDVTPEQFSYARIAVGLARTKAMLDVKKMFGRLPHASGANHAECKFEGQFGLAAAFQKAGWGLGDMVPRRRAKAFSPTGEILTYGPKEAPLMLVPIQSMV